ncbi:MAG: hydrolase Nlp/P60 [Bergeyella sp.]|nr:hydrolase Nlp/P60 [Bergeyella sp.]
MRRVYIFPTIVLLLFFVFQSCSSVNKVALNKRQISYQIVKEGKIKIKNPRFAVEDSYNVEQVIKNVGETYEELENVEKLEEELKIKSVLEEAKTYLGTPYRYGGITRKGIDCSGFVLSVFSPILGLRLPRVASAQAQEGDRVDLSEIREGDLVFFAKRSRISHVGIVYSVSEEREVSFIHASTSRGVMVSSLNSKYWAPKFKFAKRVIKTDESNCLM